MIQRSFSLIIIFKLNLKMHQNGIVVKYDYHKFEQLIE